MKIPLFSEYLIFNETMSDIIQFPCFNDLNWNIFENYLKLGRPSHEMDHSSKIITEKLLCPIATS